MDALIGHTGFVGSNLARQGKFEALFNSKNIEQMRGGRFGLVVCAGVQAKKWWANQNPEADWKGISQLLDVLNSIQAEKFALISTVDVYPNPVGVTESTPITGNNHVYGAHRYRIEESARRQFPNGYVVRLPGLFGHGLKKNVIFDLLHDNNLEQINPESVYQYYNLDHLWPDIQLCFQKDLHLLNVATEPVRTAEIIDRYFPERRSRVGPPQSFRMTYDMRSEYASLWGSGVEGYLYGQPAVLREIGVFVAQARAAVQ
jgi:hypothetical protein